MLWLKLESRDRTVLAILVCFALEHLSEPAGALAALKTLI
jgi:hypothetical protein